MSSGYQTSSVSPALTLAGDRHTEGARSRRFTSRGARLVGACGLALTFGCLSATTLFPAIARAAEGCPNDASRQGPSALLPDCRAYEQVTPVNKTGAEDIFSGAGGEGTGGAGYSAEDGNRFLIATVASFGSNGASGENAYLFSRGADGWTTTSLVAPGLGVQSLGELVYDPIDFSEVGFTPIVGSEAERSAVLDIGMIGPPGGPYTRISSVPSSENEETVGGSSNLSHIVLNSANHHLAPGDSGQDLGSRAVYDWTDGQLHLVNINTNGSLISSCGAILGQNRGISGTTHNAVSDDGSKIFLTAPDPTASGPGCWDRETLSNPPQLYMRLDGTKTVDLSAPDPGVHDPDGLQAAVYVGASADGAKVFFMSQAELTSDDLAHDPELYEYNTETATLTRISHGTSGEADGDVAFVAAISSDGSTVYFTARGQLVPGAPAVSEEQVNLYRYNTDQKTTTYIATVSESDYPATAAGKWYPEAFQQEVSSAVNANWYTTADGRFLVFATTRDITSYDSTAASGAHCEGPSGHCDEVYRYDSSDNSITCVSCDPNGAAPVSDALFARSALRADNPAGATPRPVSEDGNYVFFDSADALVSQAAAGVLHVYEWRKGAISLISAADDPNGSLFVGSSADGSNVFFGTHSQISPQDTDNSGDLYDARIDGGFGQPVPPACTETGCQGVPAAPPLFAIPSSTTFAGIGNFAAPSAKKLRARPLTRAQKLAKALKACRAMTKRRQTVCESRARKKYSARSMAKKTSQRGQ